VPAEAFNGSGGAIFPRRFDEEAYRVLIVLIFSLYLPYARSVSRLCYRAVTTYKEIASAAHSLNYVPEFTRESAGGLRSV